MGNPKDRILIVEHDPMISDLIGRQALQPLGYQVLIVGDGTAAIPQAIQFQPDAIIVDLALTGLSGKDLLVALASQGAVSPIIVLAHKGMDSDIIQSFRLGATDYLLWPVRDAEVVSVVERVLRQVRERREKEHLARQLQQTNLDLQNRVRELTAIFSIGKSVTSITDPRVLYERIIDGAVRVTNADLGWLQLRDDKSRAFILTSHRQLPVSLAQRINQPWDDGISSLVSTSGEPLSIYGEPLKRFKIASLGQAALIVPIKVQKQSIGLLTVMRQSAKSFTTSEQSLLEATADYASISIVNARLFHSLEERIRALDDLEENSVAADKVRAEVLQGLSHGLRPHLESARRYIEVLLQGKKGGLGTEQQQILLAVQEKLLEINKTIGQVIHPTSPLPPRQMSVVNLNDIARQTLAHFHRLALQNNLSLASELASPPVLAWADPVQVGQILDGLLSNAIRFSLPGGRIVLCTDLEAGQQPHIVVRDQGIGIAAEFKPRIFEPDGCKQAPVAEHAGGSAVGLNVIKEMVNASGGKVWLESVPEKGSAFHISMLPPQE
jgi:signal transduction histidine kinase